MKKEIEKLYQNGIKEEIFSYGWIPFLFVIIIVGVVIISII